MILISLTKCCTCACTRQCTKDAQAQGDAHKMTPKERRQEMIKILEGNPEISTLELSKIFSVSRSTISRDLKKLQRVAQGDAQKDAHAQDDTQK
ncbi:MAG: HTH domain-containing protein [Finegoldia magna]|nr:HTH domain-containing protein [Finegoldia magna]